MFHDKVIFILDLQELVLREQAEEDEMVSVPPGTWAKESPHHTTPSTGNTTLSKRSDEEESVDPPPRACLTMKVIYNKRWVDDAGKGDKELALCEARAVIREAEEIFNDRFAYLQCNRFGIFMKFNLVNGGTLMIFIEFYKICCSLISFLL